MLIQGKQKLSLSRWPDHTNDEHILLSSDNLLTVCEPSPAVREAYLKKVGLTEEDLKPKEPEQVLLNEEEDSPDWIDDYEPHYSES